MDNNLINIFVDAVIGKNIALYYLLGIVPLVLYKTSIKESFLIGIILSTIMIICSSVMTIINNYILIPFQIGYLRILLTLIIIFFIIYQMKILLNKLFPNLESLFEKYPEFFYTNYAVYGLVFLNINSNSKVLFSIISSFGFGIGYLIITAIFMTIKEKLEFEQKLDGYKKIALEVMILGMFSLIMLIISGFK